jgi:hypothetical protein
MIMCISVTNLSYNQLSPLMRHVDITETWYYDNVIHTYIHLFIHY